MARALHNVLYLLSDDMRADWGTYGLPVKTPHLDALANESLTFTDAFCQISVCSPSRQSFMTSVRPDRNKVWNFIDANPMTTQATPGHFKEADYLSLGLGKTFHEEQGAWNADKYWSTEVLPYFPYSSNACPHGGAGGGHCTEDDSKIYDYQLRLKALEYLSYAASSYRNTSRPFFMMVGFRDPHAPWAAPKRMYDLYSEADLAVPTHRTLSPGVPLVAWSAQLSIRLQNGTAFPFTPSSPVPDWVNRDQRHAYFAAISYVDEHIGALLGKLRDEGLWGSTIVAVHSDHGYQLGEHGMWEKKSNWDTTVRVPLMIRAPGKPHAAGARTASHTDLVDIFPTLASLAGLPAPAGVDGDDVSAVFDSPSQLVKAAAYHQYPACGMASGLNHTRLGCNNVNRSDFDFMSYSLRTPDWRYTLWLEWDKAALAPRWEGGSEAEELYGHRGDDSSDMDRWENSNLAPGKPAVVARLRAQLRAFFSRGARSE
jgi:iduronate 2-sulfatase